MKMKRRNQKRSLLKRVGQGIQAGRKFLFLAIPLGLSLVVTALPGAGDELALGQIEEVITEAGELRSFPEVEVFDQGKFDFENVRTAEFIDFDKVGGSVSSGLVGEFSEFDARQLAPVKSSTATAEQKTHPDTEKGGQNGSDYADDHRLNLLIHFLIPFVGLAIAVGIFLILMWVDRHFIKFLP